MPLQIRRGTEAERLAMTLPLAAGELVYVTDTQRLHIGNGSTLGGVAVTGFTAEDAQDAAASLFTNGTHNGISFAYNDSNDTISAVVELPSTITADLTGDVTGDLTGNVTGDVTGDLTGNVTGDVTGDVTGNLTGNVTGNVTGNLTGNVTGNVTGFHTGDSKGSVFGDDSSILVDAVQGRIVCPVFANVTGNVTGNLTGNVTGDVTGNVDGDLNGNVTGNVTGDVTGTVTGNVTGDVAGDLKGNVLDSSFNVILDSAANTVTSTFYGDLHTSTIWGSDFIDIKHETAGNATTVRRFMEVPGNHSSVFAISNGSYSTGENYNISRGTTSSPTTIQVGDTLEAKVIQAYDGSNYIPVAYIATGVDPYGSVSTGAISGSIGLTVITDGNPMSVSKTLFMDSRGYVGINNGFTQPSATLDVNGFAKLAVLTAAPASPANGMVAIADGTSWNPAGTGKSVMVVYLGGGWRVAATAP